MLEGSKNVLVSTTFWGVVLTLVGLVLNRFGIQLADQAGWANDLVILSGAVVALIGRVKATQRVKLLGLALAAMFAIQSVEVFAAPPQKWSREEWRHVGKITKTAVYHLVVDSDGIASGEELTGVGPDLPENAIVTNVYYHISTAFTGASDNEINMGCIASGDIMDNVRLHGDAQYTVASAGVIVADNPSSYVKTTSAGCSPFFSIGSGTTGYTAGQAQVMVEFVQLYPDAGLDE